MGNKSINITKTFRLFPAIFDFKTFFKKEDADKYLAGDVREDAAEIQWIYESVNEACSLVGVKDDFVFAVDSEGMLAYLCLEIQNIPFELLRIRCGFTQNELVQEVFDFEPTWKTMLEDYEKWCKENNVELDSQKAYHDASGKLFARYFVKPEDV